MHHVNGNDKLRMYLENACMFAISCTGVSMSMIITVKIAVTVMVWQKFTES